MSLLLIDGNKKLSGEISIQGSKNSVLPILAATVLCQEKCILHNCPDILDVDFSIKILQYLGGRITRSNSSLIVDMSSIKRCDIPNFLMKEMRSSIIFLGAILSRVNKAKLTLPGGCQLGPRPIDFHLRAFEKMGVEILTQEEILNCQAKEGLTGEKIELPFPSVGATENILLASVMSSGTTIIKNAAKEPEIVDLANFLNACGAKIKGAGTSEIIVDGVEKLHGAEYTVIPDRIVAATFMSAVAITGGEALFKNVNHEHLSGIIPAFEECGCKINFCEETLSLKAPRELKSIKEIITGPYPDFPTDAQALLMAVTTVSRGKSLFVEKVFQQRYKHVNELLKLGVDIKIDGKNAVVNGVGSLHSAKLCATDLRGAASLVIAALKAEGTSEISNLRHLDRGYEKLEENLRALGAKIKRV